MKEKKTHSGFEILFYSLLVGATIAVTITVSLISHPANALAVFVCFGLEVGLFGSVFL